MALDGSNIEPVLKISQLIGVTIDNGNITGFFRQVLGKIGSNFTSTKDNDFHATLRIPA